MQVQNFLDRYRQGERDFAHVDLSGASLTGANLRNINLTGANLTGANLSWSSLSHAKLTGACLHQANLHSAILNNTDFHQATLSRAKLSKVDLRWATVREADLNWVDLTEADLSGANLQKAQLNHANLEQAKLNNTLLIGVELIAANLCNASLIGSNLTGANLWEACLERASLRDAILVGTNLTEANLDAVYLRGANLSKADLHRAILTGADMSEANFEQADLSRANLTGAYLLRASLRKADLLRSVLQDVYLLRTDLSEANLRGADLRQADLSGAYLKDTILSEANLSDAYLLESSLIRTQLDRTELTGCCIYSWHLDDVDLSQVECRYVFTKFDHATKSPSDRYPPVGNLQPGQLSRENTTDSLTVEVWFRQAPNWEVLVFAIAQVQLECPDIQLTIKSYEVTGRQYVLRLSVNRLVNTKLLSQRILEVYPEMFRRLAAQRQTILHLLKIGEKLDSQKELPPQPPTASASPNPPADRRQSQYLEVVNQIQRIIMSQPPEQLVENVQQQLEFLKQQNLITEEIQKKVITQAIIKRAKNDELFTEQLLQWEQTASEAARFSLVGQAVRLAIALIWPDADSP
jgi:uncharacterized protein YjbI with pentapeptide repeats